MQQYWYATHNRTWLQLVYPGLLKETADFWVSRVSADAAGVPHINHVIPPDEYATGDDSIYTNYVAKRNLLFSAEAASVLGKPPNPKWRSIASKLPLLFNETLGIHQEFRQYAGAKIKQADVVLLGFPLMMNMSRATRKADLEYYAPRTDPGGPAMTWGMHAVALLELQDSNSNFRENNNHNNNNDSNNYSNKNNHNSNNNDDENNSNNDDNTNDEHSKVNSSSLDTNFNRSFANAQAPFLVWTETPTGGTTNFLTGVGGWLQTVLFGLPGLRVWPDHLALNPQFVDGMTRVVIRGVNYRSATLNIEYESKAGSGTTVISNAADSVATIVLSRTGSPDTTIAPGARYALPTQKIQLRAKDQ